MVTCIDGNTGNTQFVFIKDGVIGTSLPLDIEYTHDNGAFELGFVASQLLEIAQRYYNEVRELKDENARLNGRAKRPELKPSTIAKEDRDEKSQGHKITGKSGDTILIYSQKIWRRSKFIIN